MISYLEKLHWAFGAIIVMAVFISIALLGLWLTRRFVSPKNLKASHDVAGFTFGIIGVIYAVLLGFIVVEVNGRFRDAEQHVMKESAILWDLFRDTSVYPKEERNALRQVIRNYAKAVHDDEWKTMSERNESTLAKEYLQKLWETYAALTPKDDKEKIWYAQALERLNEISQERVIRLFNMNETIGPMMWTLLIMGAFFIIFFMCFFSAESQLAQALMTTVLAGTIAFMLFLILALEGIYSGDIRVHSSHFKEVIDKFDALMTQQQTD